jgi:hypothetical protein
MSTVMEKRESAVEKAFRDLMEQIARRKAGLPQAPEAPGEDFVEMLRRLNG